MSLSKDLEKQIEWKVTYDGGFWHNRGRAGREVSIRKSFVWGDEKWFVPAVYICGKGIVVDFCLEVDKDRLKDYIDKWDLLHESSNVYSREQQEQIQNENPLNPEFKAYIRVNGKELRRDHGYAVSWIPADCLNQEYQPETEARRVLEHYGLDLNHGWAIHRCAFLWSTKRAPVIRSMQLIMKRSPVTVHGTHFASPSVGDVITFPHPVTGVQHALTVHEYESQNLEQHHFRNEDMEYPACYHAMTYTLEPELGGEEFMLSDYNEGDRPRMKNPNPNEFSPVVCSSVAVIGGADGPTMILLAGGNSAKLHAACSSLYFEQPEMIEWYMRFQVKTMDDIEVELV